MRTHSTPNERGFTLLELMVAITVLGILLGLGVPAFNDIIRNNRVAAETNQLMTALAYARSEANRRGMPVSICASNVAQTACAGASTWTNGYLVFSDRDGDPGEIDGDDALIQTSRAIPRGVQLVAEDVDFLRFGADGGLLEPVAPIDFEIQHEKCRNQNRRVITLIATGRASLAREAC